VKQLIERLAQRPEPFAPGEAPLWTDPHVSRRMLAAHLDPSTDAASRRPETIAREVDWLVRTLELRPGAPVLDLGCGPGLYCAALAARGFVLTGIDISGSSLAYARQAAAEAGLGVTYVHGDYRELDEHDTYDAALLVYHDFGVLSDPDRAALLLRINEALRAGGRFAFDVVSAAADRPERSEWSASIGDGFWRSGPHLVLERQVDYPELALSCREHAVVEETGTATVYRIWEQRFSRERLERELAAAGFVLEHLTADLTGTPWTSAAETLAVVARRR
jgi:SAM-dependent methyltransferase